MLLNGLALMACSSYFLISPKTTSPGAALPPLRWAHAHEPSINQEIALQNMPMGNLIEVFSSIKIPSSLVSLDLCDKTQPEQVCPVYCTGRIYIKINLLI